MPLPSEGHRRIRLLRLKFFKLLITLLSQLLSSAAATPRIVSFLLSCVFVCFCAVCARSLKPQTLRLRSRTGRPFMHRLVKDRFLCPLKGTLIFYRFSEGVVKPPGLRISRNFCCPAPALPRLRACRFPFLPQSLKASLCFQHLYSSNISPALSTPFCIRSRKHRF